MLFDHGYYMGGMHAFWWLFWLILVLIVFFVVWPPLQRSRRSQRDSPHELLRERLAKGEITPEAYEQAKKLLDRDAADL